MTIMMRTPMAKRVKAAAPIASSRPLLTQSDFTYLGYYDVVNGLNAAGLGGGFSFRYVSSTFRGCSIHGGGEGFREFTLPGSFGGEVTLLAATDDIFDGDGVQEKFSLRWIDDKLYTASAIDYPNIGAGEDNYTSAISTREIDANGNVSNWHGYYGFHDIGACAVYGGVMKVPSWFSAANSCGTLVAGFGGYVSLMDQRALPPSLGPMFVFFDDPHGGTEDALTAANAGITSGNYKIGADHRGGTSSVDWFPNYSGRTYDRGVRKTTTVINWFESGVPGAGTPTVPPSYPSDLAAEHWWYGPSGGAAPNDPDGYSRWCWGDSYYGTGVWIDNDAGTRGSHGVIAIATLGDGNVWYDVSQLHREGQKYELHIFNPSHIAEAIAGTRAKYNVRPTHAFNITSLLEDVPVGGDGGSGLPFLKITGADYDAATGRLYVAMHGFPNGVNQVKMRLYVFSVGGA